MQAQLSVSIACFSHLAGVTLDDDVAALADLTGFRGDGVRSSSIGAGEVVVVQLVLGGHFFTSIDRRPKPAIR